MCGITGWANLDAKSNTQNTGERFCTGCLKSNDSSDPDSEGFGNDEWLRSGMQLHELIYLASSLFERQTDGRRICDERRDL